MKRQISFVLILLCTTLFANKTLTISKTETVIQIDGIIDDLEWGGSAIADGFVEVMPAENEPAITETQVFVTYDKKNLYVAFKAFDDPSKIRAHQSKRDAIFEDDMVGLILDTQNDGVMAYQFFCNPLGNQGDGQKFGQSEREDWDAVWTSSGRMTETGYEIEMAIPFSSFRVPNVMDHHWRISFFRVTPREDSRRQNSWTPFDRNDQCVLCQLGHLCGIKDIVTRSSFEFLPSLVGSQDNETRGNFGLGMKIPIGNNSTAEITINPDFSQVESNQSRIDINSHTALSYPETRPFFNEGVDLFNTGSFGWKPKVRAVYTRSINEPLIASKVLGQIGKTQIGYLGSIDQNTYLIVPFSQFGGTAIVGESMTNVIRAKHPLSEGAYVGGIFSHRNYGGGTGLLGGADGLYKINNNLVLDWQIFGSQTVEPNDTSLSSEINGSLFSSDSLTSDFDGESFNGLSSYLSIERRGRNWGGTIMYSGLSPSFRADNGFIRLNDRRGLNANIWSMIYPKNKFIEQIHLLFAPGKVYSYDWNEKEDWLFTNVSAQLKGQVNIDITYMGYNELYRGTQLDGNYDISFSISSKFSNYFSMGMTPGFGKEIIRWEDPPFQARNQSMRGWIKLKPKDNLSLFVNLNNSKSTYFESGNEIYSDLISRFRLEYQATSALNFRFVTQYHDYYGTLDIQPLISYQPDPFSIYYIGTSRSFLKNEGKWEEDFGQIYLKIQKLFSI